MLDPSIVGPAAGRALGREGGLGPRKSRSGEDKGIAALALLQLGGRFELECDDLKAFVRLR